MLRILGLLSALALAAPSPAAVDGLAIDRATIRFGAGGGARLRIDGDLRVVGGAADPTGFRLSLGSTVLLDGLPPGARVRVRRNGDWKVAMRGPSGGRIDLAVIPASGVFRLTARGFDGSALLADGPLGVACEAGAGESSGADDLDFEVRGRRWEYRRPPGVRPGPGPGNGGGGGSTLPGAGATIAQGDVSGITTFRVEVIRDAAAWQALWAAHSGGGTAPSVDFANEMVVGVWLGARSSGGHRATITGFLPATVLGVPCFEGDCPQGRIVQVLESVPGGNCAVTGVITYPHHIVRVPKEEWWGVMTEVTTRVDDCF